MEIFVVAFFGHHSQPSTENKWRRKNFEKVPNTPLGSEEILNI